MAPIIPRPGCAANGLPVAGLLIFSAGRGRQGPLPGGLVVRLEDATDAWWSRAARPIGVAGRKWPFSMAVDEPPGNVGRCAGDRRRHRGCSGQDVYVPPEAALRFRRGRLDVVRGQQLAADGEARSQNCPVSGQASKRGSCPAPHQAATFAPCAIAHLWPTAANSSVVATGELRIAEPRPLIHKHTTLRKDRRADTLPRPHCRPSAPGPFLPPRDLRWCSPHTNRERPT